MISSYQMKSFKEEMINDFIEEIGITENTNAMLKICDACNISRYAYEEVKKQLRKGMQST
jgi:predicted enzyme involved in methoxymalonyl-ACP biosynthesis